MERKHESERTGVDRVGADRATADRATADRAGAAQESTAAQQLRAAGAEGLSPRPWRPAPAPPSAVDLAHFALWRAAQEASGQDAGTLLNGLALLSAARAEVDGLEAGLLFSARGAGLTWAQIADAMGFRSPQACQQHFTRLTGRVGGRS
ncbi:SANT/Myb-like DNA-binding domain-containing protein [Brevibacterium yomogidense]|uniref:DNA-binding protein n=1 Tax=Brevibacterium yomogidense TaxID=946573 RepID=UPI0018DFF0E3|nr:DNA-binding protein [Brevibacterium yomogidense]